MNPRAKWADVLLAIWIGGATLVYFHQFGSPVFAMVGHILGRLVKRH